jgi:glucose-1-phosphate adenylyltransferase
VQADPPFHFNDPEWPFYTHPRYLPGSSLNAVRINRSIVSEGSMLEECTVESSIVGVRTTMTSATVRRSLVMGADPYPPPRPEGAPPLGIGEGSLIQDAIIDKNARIGRNVVITNKGGAAEAEGHGWAIREGIVVVTKNAVIPDGTSI